MPTHPLTPIGRSLGRPLASLLVLAACCSLAEGLDLSITTPSNAWMANQLLHFQAIATQSDLTRVSVVFLDESTNTWLPEEACDHVGNLWVLDRAIRVPGTRHAKALGYKAGVYQGSSPILTFQINPAQPTVTTLTTAIDDLGMWVFPGSAPTLGERVVVEAGGVVLHASDVIQSGPAYIPVSVIPTGIDQVVLHWYGAGGSEVGRATWNIETIPGEADFATVDAQAVTLGKSLVLLALGDSIRSTFPASLNVRVASTPAVPSESADLFSRVFSLVESAEGNVADNFNHTIRLPGAIRTIAIPTSITRALELLPQQVGTIFLPLTQKMSNEAQHQLAIKFGDSLRQALIDAGASFTKTPTGEVMSTNGLPLDTLRAAVATRLKRIYDLEGIWVNGTNYLKGQTESLALATSSARPTMMRYGNALRPMLDKVLTHWSTMSVATRNFLVKSDKLLSGPTSFKYYLGQRIRDILGKIPYTNYLDEAAIVGSNLYRNGSSLISSGIIARTSAILKASGRYVPGISIGLGAYQISTTYEKAYANATDHLLEDSSVIIGKSQVWLVQSGVPLSSLSAAELTTFNNRVFSCLADQEASAFSTSQAIALVGTNVVATSAGAATAASISLASGGAGAPAGVYAGFAVSVGVSFAITSKMNAFTDRITTQLLIRSLDARIDRCAEAAMANSLTPILDPAYTPPTPRPNPNGVTIVFPPNRSGSAAATWSNNPDTSVTAGYVQAVPSSSN